MNLDCFKAYDIRGKVPSSLSPALAREIGFAFANEFQAKNVVIGHDARLTCSEIYRGLAAGLQSAGVNVVGIGMCGTEEVYHATAFAEIDSMCFDGGIMVTGSHNPADENGMKIVRTNAVPVSGDSGLFAIKKRIEDGQNIPDISTGTFQEKSYRAEFVKKILSNIDLKSLCPLKIVADAGNGCAALALKEFMPHLPFEFILIDEEPDGHFPNGIPNPLLPENREKTATKVREHKADFGIAWDGDFDRCFFYDAAGNFIEGYYVVGMIANSMLKTQHGSKIIHDPRLTWNTIDLVDAENGIAIESKTGHAFIKERMRKEDAIYGGEMSAHHYFRDFAYCDSGMLPWLYVAQLICKTKLTLAQMVEDRIKKFPCSGEINSTVTSVDDTLQRIEEMFTNNAINISHTDGLSVEFEDWRFNVRGSNTEPVLRLNVESKGNHTLMQEMTKKLLNIIRHE